MLELITIILSAIVAVANPVMPNNGHYVYTAKASSLNTAVLAVEKVPETPPLKITQAENEGEKIAMDDFGISEGLKRNLVRENEEEKAIEGWIKLYSAQYSVSYEEMRRVMTCESGGKIDTWNKKDPFGGAKGIFQFLEPTFYYYIQEIGITNPDIWNVEQQIELTAYLFSKNKSYLWTCAKIYDNLNKQ